MKGVRKGEFTRQSRRGREWQKRREIGREDGRNAKNEVHWCL